MNIIAKIAEFYQLSVIFRSYVLQMIVIEFITVYSKVYILHAGFFVCLMYVCESQLIYRM